MGEGKTEAGWYAAACWDRCGLLVDVMDTDLYHERHGKPIDSIRTHRISP
jgi:hypothetical protein